MDYTAAQDKLLSLLPMWNYRVAKPFKQMLASGVSLEMYHCLKTLEWLGGAASMTELARWGHMQKQQATKLVNRLVEQGFVVRIDDPADRRVVRIQMTDKATEYIAHFLSHDAAGFGRLLQQMSPEDLGRFEGALDTIIDIFSRLPCDCSCCGSEERKGGCEDSTL